MTKDYDPKTDGCCGAYSSEYCKGCPNPKQEVEDENN